MGNYGSFEDLDENTKAGLRNTLGEDERFLGAISCSDAIRSTHQTRLVLTDRRLLSFKKSNGSVPIEDINRNEIQGVQYDKGILARKLTVQCQYSGSITWNLDLNGTDEFVEAVQSLSIYSIYGDHPEEIPNIDFSVNVESRGVVAQRSPSRTNKETTKLRTQSPSSTPQRTVYDLTTTELTSRLQGMDNYDFEHFVADLWERMGWQTEVSQESNDAGVDVIAKKTTPYPEKKAIQVKRYASGNKVGGPKIQQYASLKQQIPDADSAIVVTTSSFTNAAEKRAQELNVKTIDGEGLAAMIDELDARDLISKYLDIPLEVSERDPEPESESDLVTGPEERIHEQEKDSITQDSIVESNFRQPSNRESFPQPDRSSNTQLRHDLDEVNELEATISKDLGDFIKEEKLEKYIDQDLDKYLAEEEYRATRAVERSRAQVKLNPHDAKELGIFENLPDEDFERRFSEKRDQLVFLKDDIHKNGKGDVYVEDLTEYISPAAIKVEMAGPIIGVISRGIPDGAWLSDRGEYIWKKRRLTRRLKQTGRDLHSYLKKSEIMGAETSKTKKNNTDMDSLKIKRSGLENQKQEASNSQSRSANSKEKTGSEDLASLEETRDQPSLKRFDLSHSNWFYGTIAGLMGWILAIFLPDALAGFVMLISWPLLPITMFKDMKKTGYYSVAKIKSWGYLVCSAIPLMAVIPAIIYLYRREKSWE